MTTPYGALRHRLIADSLFNMVNGCLISLGWMNATAWHKPVTMLLDAVDEEDQIVFNTVAMADDDVTPEPYEMGSAMTCDSWQVWFDTYCESEVVSKALSADIQGILAGLHPDVGRTMPSLLVLDYTQATPIPLFECPIEKVDIIRVRNTLKPWMRYWRTVRCDLADEYNSSEP